MDITPVIPKNRNIINSYGKDGFKINDTTYKNTIILSALQILEVKISSIEEIFSSNLSKIFHLEPEIILIGTGQNHKIITQNFKNQIKKQYPLSSIDEMSTGSACRTYNILMSEERNVMAVLIAM
jgi:uncharacterized protein